MLFTVPSLPLPAALSVAVTTTTGSPELAHGMSSSTCAHWKREKTEGNERVRARAAPEHAREEELSEERRVGRDARARIVDPERHWSSGSERARVAW